MNMSVCKEMLKGPICGVILCCYVFMIIITMPYLMTVSYGISSTSTLQLLHFLYHFWEILFLFYMHDCFPCMYEHALCVHNGKGVSRRKLCPLELEL